MSYPCWFLFWKYIFKNTFIRNVNAASLDDKLVGQFFEDNSSDDLWTFVEAEWNSIGGKCEVQ